MKDVRYYVEKKLAEKHEQYLIGVITDHDNELAKEIRHLYCSLNDISRISIINLAHTSGLLAGSLLFPNKTCARVTSVGTNLLLQQCVSYKVTLNATLTNCGCQPTYNNKTVSRDSWTLEKFSPCYWSDGFISVNNKVYILSLIHISEPTRPY